MNYEPFDIEKAKRGAPVITRDGRSVRILCFDRLDRRSIVGLVKSENDDSEHIYSWNNYGSCLGHHPFDKDLFHPVEEMWVNVYKASNGSHSGSNIYSSADEARKKRKNNPYLGYCGPYKLIKE